MAIGRQFEARVGTSRLLDDPDVLRQFVCNLREGIYITTAEGEVLDANPAFLQMFGVRTVAELRAHSARDLVADPAQRRRELEILHRDGEVREFELKIRRTDGETCTVLDTAYAVRDPETGELFFHGILVDISGRKQLEDRLRQLTLRDPLTGCYNRRHLEAVAREMAADPDAPWGCIFIDVDRFKRLNDEHGHQAGDLVLTRLARFLTRTVRAEEAVVRVGGDEFVILFQRAEEAEVARIAERLRDAAPRTAPVAFSLGWAVRRTAESLDGLLARADQNLLRVRVDRAADRRAGGRA